MDVGHSGRLLLACGVSSQQQHFGFSDPDELELDEDELELDDELELNDESELPLAELSDSELSLTDDSDTELLLDDSETDDCEVEDVLSDSADELELPSGGISELLELDESGMTLERLRCAILKKKSRCYCWMNW